MVILLLRKKIFLTSSFPLCDLRVSVVNILFSSKRVMIRQRIYAMKLSLLFWLFLLPLLALAACGPEKVPGPGSQTTPTAAASGQGILKGSVTVGPLSPVQRAPEASVPTETVSPDVYTSRSVNLYQADGTTLVQVIHFKGDGTYQV